MPLVPQLRSCPAFSFPENVFFVVRVGFIKSIHRLIWLSTVSWRHFIFDSLRFSLTYYDLSRLYSRESTTQITNYMHDAIDAVVAQFNLLVSSHTHWLQQRVVLRQERWRCHCGLQVSRTCHTIIGIPIQFQRKLFLVGSHSYCYTCCKHVIFHSLSTFYSAFRRKI